MPSGSFRPSLTRVFKSEPSGFTESTRPPPKSRKNNRPEVGPESAFACFDPETPERPVIVLLIAHLPGLRPLDKRAGWHHSNADCQFHRRQTRAHGEPRRCAHRDPGRAVPSPSEHHALSAGCSL